MDGKVARYFYATRAFVRLTWRSDGPRFLLPAHPSPRHDTRKIRYSLGTEQVPLDLAERAEYKEADEKQNNKITIHTRKRKEAL